MLAAKEISEGRLRFREKKRGNIYSLCERSCSDLRGEK